MGRKREADKWRRRAKRVAFVLVAVVVLGLLLPASQIIPVEDATTADWNHDTFWYHPWGSSGVHKGIDIFADEGKAVVASTGGIVVYSGQLSKGGHVIAVLGPKWRLHYYAHLGSRSVSAGTRVSKGEPLGTVGTSGNAQGKPPHLHYSILTAVPYPWRVRWQRQGWKRMFYLNPDRALRP